MAWEGVKWGMVGGPFLATPGTANETSNPVSVNKARSAVCVEGERPHAQRFAFVFHLKPVSDKNCRNVSWHVLHH